MSGRGLAPAQVDVFRDTELTAKAKGVYGFLATLPDPHGVSASTVAAYMRESYLVVRGCMRELQEHGHLIRGEAAGEATYSLAD
jgi:hypothetical protein